MNSKIAIRRTSSFFFICIALFTGPALAEKDVPPFYIGVFVGADPFNWGDLKPSEDGVRDIPTLVQDLGQRGFNAAWVTGFDGNFATEELIPVWLDAAQANGLHVVIEGSGGPFAIQKVTASQKEQMFQHLRSEVIPKWRSIAGQWKDHPALLAYCPVEEIGDNVELGENHTVQALADVGRAVYEIDPIHPVTTIHIATWINVAREEAKVRGNNMKVEVADLYVFTHVHDWSESTTTWATSEDATSGYLQWIQDHVKVAKNAGVPMWIMAQSYASTWFRKINGEVQSRENSRMPTPAEMHFQVWGALVAGAKGIFFFPYNGYQEPSEETKATLEDWEVGTGLRNLDGVPSEGYQELTKLLTELRPSLDLLGRLKPLEGIVTDGVIVGRLFQDPLEQVQYVIVLNRDVENSHDIPPRLQNRWKLSKLEKLKPGRGVLVRIA